MSHRHVLQGRFSCWPTSQWANRALRFFLEWKQDLQASWGTAKQLLQKQLAQQYRYSWLGLFWAVMPSALIALVLMGGQQASIRIGEISVPGAFYGVFGVAMAQTFIEAINTSRLIFTRNQQLFRRYKVPLDGFILAGFLEVLLNAAVRLMVVGIVFISFRIFPATQTLPLCAIGFFAVACQGTGLGLICAPLNSLKIDFDNFFVFAPWIIFAVTPVFSPLKTGSIFFVVSQKVPLTHLFESTRTAAYGGSTDPWGVIPGLVLGLFMMGTGWAFCRLARPYVIERIL